MVKKVAKARFWIGRVGFGMAVEVCWGDVWSGGDCFGESRFGCQGTVGMDPAGSGKAVKVRLRLAGSFLVRIGSTRLFRFGRARCYEF